MQMKTIGPEIPDNDCPPPAPQITHENAQSCILYKVLQFLLLKIFTEKTLETKIVLCLTSIQQFILLLPKDTVHSIFCFTFIHIHVQN